jgi:hypothetical protein
MGQRSNWLSAAVLGLVFAAITLSGLVTIGPAGAEVEREMANGINIPGGDIASFALQDPDPAFCRQACDQNAQCRAWTFVKPGVQGSQAMCWIKGTIGGGQVDPNTISGIKPNAGGPVPGGARVASSMSLGINLPGSDLTSLVLPRSDPALCQAACDANGQCRAWSFVKPGVQGPQATCWLKTVAPRAVSDDNVISGLRLVALPAAPAPSPAPAAGGGPAGFGVWAFAAGGDLSDPCAIQYVTTQLAGNRYDANPAYTLVRTRATAVEAAADLDHFSRYGRDQPDGVVKLETCEADEIDNPNAPPGPGVAGGNPTDFGVWASAAGGQWGDPCAIQYNAARLAGNRYDADPGYRRVRTRATQQEADLDILQFSRYQKDQPDDVVKFEPCEGGSDDGDSSSSSPASRVQGGNLAQWMTGIFNTSEGRMTLSPGGGTYDQDSGRIIVTRIDGATMEGRWQEGSSAQRCADGTYGGRFSWTFTANGFSGSWGYCDGPLSNGWTGTKVQ